MNITGRGWRTTYSKNFYCIKSTTIFRIALSIDDTMITGKIYGEMTSTKHFLPVADLCGTYVDDILRFKAVYRTTLLRPHVYYQVHASPQHVMFNGVCKETREETCDYSQLCLTSTGAIKIIFCRPLPSL
jgi:hypothetical protein